MLCLTSITLYLWASKPQRKTEGLSKVAQYPQHQHFSNLSLSSRANKARCEILDTVIFITALFQQRPGVISKSNIDLDIF